MKALLVSPACFLLACDAGTQTPTPPAPAPAVLDGAAEQPEAPAPEPEPSAEELLMAKAKSELEALRAHATQLEACAASEAPAFDEAAMLALQESDEGRAAVREQMQRVITAKRACEASAAK